MRGVESIVDAHGCNPAALRDEACLRTLFTRLIADLQLTPVAPGVWHTFPPPGGITGMVALAESHLTCHTFPEFGSVCLNLFCCRARPDIDLDRLLANLLGASHTVVRRLERVYALQESVQP